MKPRAKFEWRNLQQFCSWNAEILVMSLFADGCPPVADAAKRYALALPTEDTDRQALDAAAESILAGVSVRSSPPTVRWQLIWRLQAAAHLLRWYSYNPPSRNDTLAATLNSLRDREVLRCLLLDSSNLAFAMLGAAGDYLLADISCTPGVLKMMPAGKEIVLLDPIR